MKHLLFLLAISCAGMLNAQQTSGVVTYEEAIHIDADIQVDGGNEEDEFEGLPPDIAEQVKAAMANLPKQKKQLTFTADASLMQKVKEEEKMRPPGKHGMHIMIMNDDDEAIIHHSLADNALTEQHLFLDKKFLIQEEAPSHTWKMTGKTKELLGQMVLEATAQQDSAQVVAWFAPQIPVSSGPMGIGGLPGLILELSLDDGGLTYTATELDLRAVTSEEIAAPRKGKKISREDFNALRAERMEKMEGEGGGRQMEITIRN